ncbi:MAG: single-stranded DNA-binding protein [Lactimicrobium sp.]|jgi:single-strand DNA-binding protein|uniref:single-stranded DNA-binding protein n=1 Tax=Lactimicrobium sp. TaxID=2563780 RepID=UPI002F34FD2B
MINRVVLIGRLTKDVEVRKTNSGLSVAQFTVAVDRRVSRDSNGQQNADFVPCVAWRQSADFLGSYARKGNLVGVEGRIQTRNYDDKDGKKVYVTEVVCDNVQLLQSKGASQGTDEPQPRSSAEYRQQKAEEKTEAQPNPYSMKEIKKNSTAQQIGADSLSCGTDTTINPDDLPF